MTLRLFFWFCSFILLLFFFLFTTFFKDFYWKRIKCNNSKQYAEWLQFQNEMGYMLFRLDSFRMKALFWLIFFIKFNTNFGACCDALNRLLKYSESPMIWQTKPLVQCRIYNKMGNLKKNIHLHGNLVVGEKTSLQRPRDQMIIIINQFWVCF